MLIISPPGICWDIMGYESEPLPSYHDLRNFSYNIMLRYTPYLSTLQVYLYGLGLTIAPTGSSPESVLPPCTYHRWGNRPPFPLLLPVASLCTPWWSEDPGSPLPPPPRYTPNLCLPRISPSSPLSVTSPSIGTPPRHWTYLRSPHIFFWRTRAPTAPLTVTSLPRPAPLLPSFTALFIPFPTASKISAVFGRPLPNRCCCSWLSALGMEKPPVVLVSLNLSETRPCFHRSSIVMSCVLDAFPLPYFISLMSSGRCLVYLLGLGFRSARTWGGGWGVPPGYWSVTPIAGW